MARLAYSILLATVLLSASMLSPFSPTQQQVAPITLGIDDGLEVQNTAGRNGTNYTGTTFNWTFPRDCWGSNESINIQISMANITLQQIMMWWQLGSNDNGSVLDSGTPILNVSSNGSLSHTLSIPPLGVSQASVEIFIIPKTTSSINLFQNNFLRTNTIHPSCASTNVTLPLANLNIPGFQEGSIYTNTTLSAGDQHTCTILDNGSVSCWGVVGHEQLDTPRLSASLGLGRTASALSSGGWHRCVILDNGSVSCWGKGGYGQLGNGVSPYLYQPTLTSSLGTGRTAVAISSGEYHTCAILDNGSVSCWGGNWYGSLGDGTNAHKSTPTLTSGFGNGSMAIAISSGENHTCAVIHNGSVSCWGRNTDGQLGNGGNTDSVTPTLTGSLGEGRTAVAISSGGHHTCVILDNGAVSCWGHNMGSGGPGTNSPTLVQGLGGSAIAISSGRFHTCALLDNGSVSCWGKNDYGQLGIGSTSNQNSPTQINTLGTNRTALAISSGNVHVCAVLDNGSISCWGDGGDGQIGNGASQTEFSPTPINSLGNGRSVAMSERDFDGDGILNIFDSNPHSRANVYPTNWTLTPNQGPHTGGSQLNISGDFSWIYDSMENTSASQGPINHTWNSSTMNVPSLWDYSTAIDSGDNLHLAYVSYSRLEYMVNSNGNWSTPLTIENLSSYGHCSIAVDSQGNPHIAYWNGTHLKYISSSTGSWNQPTIFDQITISSSELFIDGNDNVHILYHNSTDKSLSLRTYDGTEWSILTIDNSSYATSMGTMYVDSNEEIHVTYSRNYGNSNYELMYYTYNGSSWSNSSINSSVAEGASIVVDSSSTVHVVYGSRDIDELELKHALLSEGTWAITTIDQNLAGSGTSLAIDSNDNLYLLYTSEAADLEVNFASYNGTTWSTTTLSINESQNSKIQMEMDSVGNLFGVYQSIENAGDALEYLIGTADFTIRSELKVDFAGHGNITANFVSNNTISVTSPSGPLEGGNVTVTVWFEGQGYVLSTPYRFLPNSMEDGDSDGIPDDIDDCPSEYGNSTQDQVGCPDLDLDGYSDLNDAFPSDASEWSDTDSDGIGDNSDIFPADSNEWADSDNDGIGDNGDAFPLDPTEWKDSDQDGTGDNSDAFPNDPAENLDSDDDGVGDNSDAFPNDANETVDSDDDGVGDNQDMFPHDANETADADGDGLGDNEDEFPFIHNFIDSDEDGYPDLYDDFIDDPTQWSDFDGDGFGDFHEGNNPDAFINNATQWSDTDGDGYGDNWGNVTWNLTRLFIWPGQYMQGAELADHCPTEFGNSTADGYFGCPDLDGDGIADIYDDIVELNSGNTTNETATVDTDGDGVADLFDLCPATIAGGFVDIDGCLLDKDGDGVDDLNDACPRTPSGAQVSINGCIVEKNEEKSFIESLRSGEQETVLKTVGFGAVMIAVLGFLQTNMVAALLPDSLRWIRVFRTGVKLNQEEIRELEYLKSLVQTYYLDLETLQEELYQLKSELSARYTNSEIKKLTKEKLSTLINDLLNMEVDEVHRVAHNDAFFGLGGALSTQQRTDYLAQEALMRIDDKQANLPQFEDTKSSNEFTPPSSELSGERNHTDGYEYLEHPPGSENWYFRTHAGEPWNKWNQ